MFSFAFMCVLGGSFPIMLPLCNLVIPPLAVSCYLVTLSLKFDLLSIIFNLGHNLRTVRDRAFIFHMTFVYSLWQDLSHQTIIFYLVTLTLKFDLLFKNLNFGHNLWPCKTGLSFFTCVLWQDLLRHSIIFDLVTLNLKFDLLFKNFSLGHNLWTLRDKAFIFHMCIPCDKTFHTIP